MFGAIVCSVQFVFPYRSFWLSTRNTRFISFSSVLLLAFQSRARRVLSTFVKDVVVVLMSWTTFWFSPSSTGGKLSRVLIGLVTISMLLSNSRWNDDVADESHDYTADVWKFGCLLAVCIAFIESVVVIALTPTDDSISTIVKVFTPIT
jgi:hypothetical protein